ncbi:Uu.00g011290.m01.CDS01 [Anthostomella pinea]|uniref:Uu.00g011290.m01.CDS01 n=1 Tax=Anthostomella pinea TaxID=933095 RepID=A0AAI8YQ54_9PEZI|nr:Uu.00g011290.m01.CDS01 [Anthostomella pinea]
MSATLYPRIATLRDAVKSHFVPERGDKKFLPDHLIGQLVTRDAVKSALEDADLEETAVEDLVEYVLNHARRLFLILVLMTTRRDEKVSLLQHLKQNGIKDKYLPLRIDFDKDEGHWYGVSMEKTEPETEPETEPSRRKFLAKELWEDNDGHCFNPYQWNLTAPVFGPKFRYEFHPDRTLPYLLVPEKPASSGFFGEVSRFEIHPEHIPSLKADSDSLSPIHGGRGIAVAIKKAKHDDELADFFDKEADTLKVTREFRTSQHLVQTVAAFRQGNDRCIIFPWADGGNLFNYWVTSERDRCDKECMQWIIGQFTGLCGVVRLLHSKNGRHGDLKPENILWLKDKALLQIADLGLTTFHEEDANTKKRNWKGMGTVTPSGTQRYEPPEMDGDRGMGTSRSRQYDIWSMGCIILELLVWLMYGIDGVNTFRDHTFHFWIWTQTGDGGRKYYLNPYVESCMDIMNNHLQEESAHKDLLNLVRNRLLVVPVHEEHVSSPDHREIAEQLHADMEEILESCKSDSPYLQVVDRSFPSSEIEKSQRQPVYESGGNLAVPGPAGPGYTLQASPDPSTMPTSDGDDVPRVLVRAPTAISDNQEVACKSFAFRTADDSSAYDDLLQQSRKLNDVWESVSDNDFAAQLFDLIGWDQVQTGNSKIGAVLCHKCRTIDSTRLFGLLQEALGIRGYKSPKVVSLREDGRTVGIQDGPDLLSIYVDPGPDVPQEAQLGLPKLFEPGSPKQFTLLKQWIQVCDSTHPNCRRHSDKEDDEKSIKPMPTRLIQLKESLRLVDSASISPSRYVALSHCWGKTSDLESSCTYQHNIAERKKSIDFHRLPRTFQDAVVVARGIDVHYLWIDSLCIIQDDMNDWEYESRRMEQVFSAAYCTLAASSAKSSVEGFLKYRQPRSCVQLETKSLGRLYVCQNIDDFHRDVELGGLNTRGWVLQERVLSRRSIFFTSTQVYWECGAGVHCETLARLKNSKAAFLGDANFPESALEYYRDGRQMLVQDLFERYSSLAFTKNWDRPVAIIGLQERLAKAFRTQAAYGFFAPYFGRLLLWKRLGSRHMTRIIQQRGIGVPAPTWSFFSKEGAIKYLELKFQEVDWATNDFDNPFYQRCTGVIVLSGLARGLKIAKFQMLVSISFDEHQEFEVEDLKCVVIGRDKINSGTENGKYHVLVIHQVNSAVGADIYERVGVASLKPEHVEGTGQRVTIG